MSENKRLLPVSCHFPEPSAVFQSRAAFRYINDTEADEQGQSRAYLIGKQDGLSLDESRMYGEMFGELKAERDCIIVRQFYNNGINLLFYPQKSGNKRVRAVKAGNILPT